MTGSWQQQTLQPFFFWSAKNTDRFHFRSFDLPQKRHALMMSENCATPNGLFLRKSQLLRPKPTTRALISVEAARYAPFAQFVRNDDDVNMIPPFSETKMPTFTFSRVLLEFLVCDQISHNPTGVLCAMPVRCAPKGKER